MKERLTITLSHTILEHIDAMIDRVTIRNRSHAIEQLIQQSLQPRLTTAVILAGGAHYQEKVLVTDVAGKTVFERWVAHLRQAGIERVVVALHRDEQLVKHLRKFQLPGMELAFSQETSPQGTAGALRHARKFLPTTAPVLVVQGDVITTIDIAAMLLFHQQEQVLATIGVKPRLSRREYGQVFVQGSHVVTFSEAGQESGISIINSGVYLLEPAVWQSVSNRGVQMLESDVFPKLAEADKLRAFFFQGSWFDISDPLQLAAARKKLKTRSE